MSSTLQTLSKLPCYDGTPESTRPVVCLGENLIILLGDQMNGRSAPMKYSARFLARGE